MQEEAARAREHCLEMLGCSEKIPDEFQKIRPSGSEAAFRSGNGRDNALFIANRHLQWPQRSGCPTALLHASKPPLRVSAPNSASKAKQ